jgi:hypothetical protein
MTFDTNSVYSFDLHAPGILGSSYKNVTCTIGSMSERAAIRADCKTREIHAQVFNQLPIGTPNDAGAYTYAEFQTMTGETVVLGLPWIKEDSVQKILSQNYNVKVAGISSSDLPRLRNALLTSDFKNFEITLAE